MYSIYGFTVLQGWHFRIEELFPPYTLFVWLSMTLLSEINKVIVMIAIVTVTILLFNFAGMQYSFVLFFLLLIALSIYLILFWVKDMLLRESHMYLSLSDELAYDALRQDVKNYIQLFTKRTEYAVYLTSILYVIFVISLFTMVFRLEFVRPVAPIFGLDYFF